MNYTILHCHTDLTNPSTNIDSVTKYKDYIKRAKELNMKAIAFTEHGNIFSWLNKKQACNDNNIKYIHGVEMYVTESLDNKIRDNYHVCLYAKNYNGVLELNTLISNAHNRNDGHFYYVPRITLDELFNTSSNILMTTACVGGLLAKGTKDVINKTLEFMVKNSNRCWLEVQHHNDPVQVEYNKKIIKWSEELNLNIIVGTDTHALNKTHAIGRSILQKAKGIHFDGEDSWDITLKSYDELIELYTQQMVLNKEQILLALENTNNLAELIEDFTVDTKYKYPKMSDTPLQDLKSKVWQGAKDKGIYKYPNWDSEYIPRIKHELETFEKNGALDFLLLDSEIKEDMRKEGIFCGPSRGSVSGSVVAYLIGITEMDSIKHKLNFDRFMNLERVTLGDIDSDYEPSDRERVKEYIYSKKGLHCSDIITFNTVALKGSIRDVARALDIPLNEVNNICNAVDSDEENMRKQYPKLFEYVDIIQGTVVSCGIHPCGLVVSPISLHDNIGTATLSGNPNPVSMLYMKEIEKLNFVKLDVLGLDNIEIINDTCKLANIPRLMPDNVIDDEKVWLSMVEDTLGIFQWESDSAKAYLKELFSKETISKIKEKNPNFKYIDLFSVGNGAIRPAGASYRNELAQGIFKDNGHKALNDFLSSTLGYLVYQEQIIEFLNKFCGYTMGEADIIRRGFAKKTGTDQYIPSIKQGFIKTMKDKYGVEESESEKIIVDFLKVIEDASDYLFSLNHSLAYSYIGYMCGYLRYYYPLEFLTIMLNINNDNIDKTTRIVDYAAKKNINIEQALYGKSKADYFIDRNTNTIYKGVKSVKYLNKEIAEELYSISKTFNGDFIDLITTYNFNSRQIDVLIKIGYFNNFGDINELLFAVKLVDKYHGKKQFSKDIFDNDLLRKYSKVETEKLFKEVDTLALIKDIYRSCAITRANIKDMILWQIEFIGTSNLYDSSVSERMYVVLDIETKYTPTATLYQISTGEIKVLKIAKSFYREKPIKVNDIIFANNITEKNKRKLVNGEWVLTDDKDIYMKYFLQ